MSRFWRVLAGVMAAVTGASALTSCPVYGMAPAYGVQYVPLTITSFSYSPPSPAHVGDTLTFVAQLELADMRTADVSAGNLTETLHVTLHDDGVAPDATAGDSIFTGSGQWLAQYGTGQTQAVLSAQGNKQGAAAHGNAMLPLDVEQ
jgi:hypothetical protein